MADDWQSLTELAATPATDDEVLVKDTSDTTDDAVGTVKRNSRSNFLGSVLGATTASFTTADETKLDGIEALADVTDAANVAAAGAHMAGGTDVPVLDGGTGASTPAGARTNLELVVGTHVQAWDAQLDTWATVTPSANGQSLVTAADYGAMRTLLDLEAGTDFYSISAANAAFQPIHADLTAIVASYAPASAAGPTTFAFAEDTDNGVNTITLSAPSAIASNVTLTLQGVSGQVYSSNGTDVPVVDGGTGASDASGARTNLGLVIGTDVAPVNNAIFTGTVTLPDGALAIADTSGLQSALDLKAPLASPVFTTALTAANPTFTGTVTIPDGALAIADTSGLQTALDLKAPLASPTFTGTVTVPNDSISYAEIQNVSATDRLLGRDTAAAGDIEELTVTGGLEFTGGPGIQRSALTGDVTATAGSNATTIANNAVTDVKLRDGLALSVVGRSANSTGDPADIQATAASAAVLRESGSVLGFGTIATAGIANSAVTYAKIQNVTATDRLLGRSTAGAGVVEEITCTATGRSILDDTTTAAVLTTIGALPLAGGTLSGALELGGQTIGGHLSKVVTSVTGTLVAATHSGNVLVTSGNVTVPSTAGFCGTLVFGGAHTISFNDGTLKVSPAMATGDVVSFVVQSSTVIKANKVAAASLVAFA